MSCPKTKADTRRRLKPRLPPRSSRINARPEGGTEGAGTALSKLREVDFQQNNQDWWGLLAAVISSYQPVQQTLSLLFQLAIKIKHFESCPTIYLSFKSHYFSILGF